MFVVNRWLLLTFNCTFLSLFWLLIDVVPLQRGNVPVPILRGFTDDWATLWRWYLKLKAMATAAHQLSPMSHCWFDSSSCDMTCKFRFFFVITHYKPILNLIDSQIFPVFFFSGGWSCDAPLHGAVDRCQDLLRYNQDWMGHLVQTGAASRAVSTVRRSLQCKHIIIQYI